MTAKSWDFFISHASETKKVVARPLHDLLVEEGHRVWLDEVEITLGDSLTAKIDGGLANSRFGIVILSPAFFHKEWTQKELGGLVAREVVNKSRVILPVLHDLTLQDLVDASPMMADRVFVRTTDGLPVVAAQAIEVLRSDETGASVLEGSVSSASTEVRHGATVIGHTDRVYNVSGDSVTFAELVGLPGRLRDANLFNTIVYNGSRLQPVHCQSFAGFSSETGGPIARGLVCKVIE